MINTMREKYMLLFDYIDKHGINCYNDLIHSLRANNEYELFDLAIENYDLVCKYLQNPNSCQ